MSAPLYTGDTDWAKQILMVFHLLPLEAQKKLLKEAEQLSREEAGKQAATPAPAGLDPDIWGDVISDLGGA
jgi:hypothetical protein